MLGLSSAGAARRCTTSLKARLGATKSKAPRVAVLRGAGIDTAVWQRISGKSTTTTYGEDLIEVAHSMLEQQRAAAAKPASAPGGGKNNDLSIWHADARGQTTDPAMADHELPINALARAAWKAWWGTDPKGSGDGKLGLGSNALGAMPGSANAQFS